MPVYKNVIDILKKQTIDPPHKTIAQAMIDGTISIRDLAEVNTSMAFPQTTHRGLNLPEGEYSSAEVMQNFVEEIGPYLSDKALYKLTHMLADVETSNNSNTQAYRTSTLAKAFMQYEYKRHADKTPSGNLPEPILSHVKSYILPLNEKHWPNQLKHNINTFVAFNLFNNSVSALQKNFYESIESFGNFNADSLSSTPPIDGNIAAHIKELEQDYKQQAKSKNKKGKPDAKTKNPQDSLLDLADELRKDLKGIIVTDRKTKEMKLDFVSQLAMEYAKAKDKNISVIVKTLLERNKNWDMNKIISGSFSRRLETALTDVTGSKHDARILINHMKNVARGQAPVNLPRAAAADTVRVQTSVKNTESEPARAHTVADKTIIRQQPKTTSPQAKNDVFGIVDAKREMLEKNANKMGIREYVELKKILGNIDFTLGKIEKNAFDKLIGEFDLKYNAAIRVHDISSQAEAVASNASSARKTNVPHAPAISSPRAQEHIFTIVDEKSRLIDSDIRSNKIGNKEYAELRGILASVNVTLGKISKSEFDAKMGVFQQKYDAAIAANLNKNESAPTVPAEAQQKQTQAIPKAATKKAEPEYDAMPAAKQKAAAKKAEPEYDAIPAPTIDAAKETEKFQSNFSARLTDKNQFQQNINKIFVDLTKKIDSIFPDQSTSERAAIYNKIVDRMKDGLTDKLDQTDPKRQVYDNLFAQYKIDKPNIHSGKLYDEYQTLPSALDIQNSKDQLIFIDLINNLQRLKGADLGNKAFKKEINELIEKLTNIDKKQKDGSMKLHLAAGVLYDEFGKEKEKAKSINVFFNREHKPEQFIDKINHDNKNFHYARVVALLLESIHAQNDSVRKHSMPSGATLESKVQVPADKEYSKFVAALLDPESRDKFNKFISNIQPAKLTEIDAYNLFSHRCELDVASVKKCWPELSSEYKLSDKEIGKLLLCSKDEADKIIAKVAEKQMNAFQLGNELVDALGGKKVSQSQQAQSASKIINDLSKVKDGMEAIKEQIQQEKTPKREAKL